VAAGAIYLGFDRAADNFVYFPNRVFGKIY